MQMWLKDVLRHTYSQNLQVYGTIYVVVPTYLPPNIPPTSMHTRMSGANNYCLQKYKIKHFVTNDENVLWACISSDTSWSYKLIRNTSY